MKYRITIDLDVDKTAYDARCAEFDRRFPMLQTSPERSAELHLNGLFASSCELVASAAGEEVVLLDNRKAELPNLAPGVDATIPSLYGAVRVRVEELS